MVEDVKVYDKVWTMENDRPVEKLVFAVVQSMDFFKRGVEFRYHLVDRRLGAGWGNNQGIERSPEKIFSTKAEVLASL